MINKKIWLMVLFTVSTMGITVVDFNSCSKNMDSHLNGTWALDEENPIIQGRGGSTLRVTFNNGNIAYSNSEDGQIYFKGTYIINDGKILETITHQWNRAEKKLQELSEPHQNTIKYSVNGKKLILDDCRYFGNIFIGITLELIREKETLKLNSSKESVSVIKSSGSVSSFPGRWQLIEGLGDAKDVELFKDGTGTADGKGITWKIENGRFHILHPLYTFSAIYNVTGSTVTFTKEDGAITKYQKK